MYWPTLNEPWSCKTSLEKSETIPTLCHWMPSLHNLNFKSLSLSWIKRRRWQNKYEIAFRSGAQQKSPPKFTCWCAPYNKWYYATAQILTKTILLAFYSPASRLPPSPKLARVTQFAVNYLFYFLCSLRNYLPLFCFSLFFICDSFSRLQKATREGEKWSEKFAKNAAAASLKINIWAIL